MRTWILIVCAGVIVSTGMLLCNTSPQRADANIFGIETRLEFVIFSADFCTPCKKFEADYENHVGDLQLMMRAIGKKQQNGKYYTKVESIKGQWRGNTALMTEFTRTTGKRITSVPIFWIRGTQAYRAEYK